MAVAGILKSLKEGFTDEDNSQDAFLLGFGVGLIGIVVLTGAGLYHGNPPSLTDYAQSIGWLTAGCGGGYGFKRLGEKYGSGDPSVPQG